MRVKKETLRMSADDDFNGGWGLRIKASLDGGTPLPPPQTPRGGGGRGVGPGRPQGLYSLQDHVKVILCNVDCPALGP